MNAQEVLVRLVREHTKSFLRAAKCFPADKLTWQMGPQTRTPLDILQEVATISRMIPEVVRNRRMNWGPEIFARHKAERAKLTRMDELIAGVESCTELIVSTIQATDPAVFDQPVQVPWPGDTRVVDILDYHTWNLSYHEGQLVYILVAMGLPTPFDH